ncbi:hypothetical protein PSPO01_12369 [Paraphaeosphaeria sporulosa]
MLTRRQLRQPRGRRLGSHVTDRRDSCCQVCRRPDSVCQICHMAYIGTRV